VLFQVHRKNLETHSEGFAGGQDFSTQDEVVDLTVCNSRAALAVHLSTTSPGSEQGRDRAAHRASRGSRKIFVSRSNSDLPLIPQVCEPCSLRLFKTRLICCDRTLSLSYPLQILQYASRHRHKELMDSAAEGVLKMDELPSEGQPREVPGWVRVAFLPIALPS
jgi:hypothetical protein